VVVILDFDDRIPAAERLDRIRETELTLRDILVERKSLPPVLVEVFPFKNLRTPDTAARDRYWQSACEERPKV
jgi:hypothetical protein